MTEEQTKPRMTVQEYIDSQLDAKKLGRAIVKPTIEAESYEIKPGIIRIIKEYYQYHGNDDDQDPYDHISDFLEICDTFRLRGVSDEAVRLLLFPFSLKDKAKNWLRSLPHNSITTWDQLEKKFVREFYPLFEIAQERNNNEYEVKKKDKVDIADLKASIDNLANQMGQISYASIDNLANQVG